MINSDLLIVIKKVEEWSPNSVDLFTVYLRGTDIEHVDKLCDLSDVSITVFLAGAHLHFCESEKLKWHSKKKKTREQLTCKSQTWVQVCCLMNRGLVAKMLRSAADF